MQGTGFPRFAGTSYYRYHHREQRFAITDATRTIHYPFPNATSVTWLESPEAGVAKVEVSELSGPVDDTTVLPDTELTRTVEAWLEDRLKRHGIERLHGKDAKINWLA